MDAHNLQQTYFGGKKIIT